MMDHLVGTCAISKIELGSRYHQIQAKSEDLPMTEFSMAIMNIR